MISSVVGKIAGVLLAPNAQVICRRSQYCSKRPAMLCMFFQQLQGILLELGGAG